MKLTLMIKGYEHEFEINSYKVADGFLVLEQKGTLTCYNTANIQSFGVIDAPKEYMPNFKAPLKPA